MTMVAFNLKDEIGPEAHLIIRIEDLAKEFGGGWLEQTITSNRDGWVGT